MNISGRVKKLEAQVAEIMRQRARSRPPSTAERGGSCVTEFSVVYTRWMAAVPPERRDAVKRIFSDYWALRQTDPKCSRPAIVSWVYLCAYIGGLSFPDPIPVALIDAYLSHPEARTGGYQCRECGALVPTLLATGKFGTPEFRDERPVFDVCPCGGPVGWFAYRNRHGGRVPLPSLGAELLAGRDPISSRAKGATSKPEE